jgi:ABC-type sulfate transport system substrate-binding protein
VLAKYESLPEGHALHYRRGLWRLDEAQKTHFDDGGIFDRIYEPGS